MLKEVVHVLMYEEPKNTKILMVYKDAGSLFKWLRKKHWEILRYKMLEGERSIQIRVVDTDTGKEKLLKSTCYTVN